MKPRLGSRVWLRASCAALLGCAAGGCNRHLGEWEADGAREVEVQDASDAAVGGDPPPSAWRDTDPAAPSAPLAPDPPKPPASVGLQRCEPLRLDESCALASGVHVADDATLATMDAVYYFASGAVLPAGHYRLAYVDGCMSFNIGLDGVFGWSINSGADDPVTGLGSCWLVGDDGRLITLAPGSGGLLAGMGAYATYDACVEANCSVPAVEFDFEGGRLGMRYGGIPALVYITGATQGGRGPTFHLTRTGPCP